MSRAKTIKIADPCEYFSSWFFAINPHHYGTLGVELRTFVLKKIPYQSHALMNPPEYGFSQGYIFYERTNPNHYLQVGAEQGLFGMEVFEGWITPKNQQATGLLITISAFAHWLQTGIKPNDCTELDYVRSKSGLMARALQPMPAIEQPSQEQDSQSQAYF